MICADVVLQMVDGMGDIQYVVHSNVSAETIFMAQVQEVIHRVVLSYCWSCIPHPKAKMYKQTENTQ